MALSILWPDGTPYNERLDSTELNAGKTKQVLKYWGDVALVHNWVLTANDDPEFTWYAPDKWVASAYSSALLFKRLEGAGVRTSHRWVINANTTRETALEMLPFEIIWRKYNVPKNSWEKRHPWIHEIGAKYPENIYEVCLKWSVITESWEIIHDPFLVLDDNFQPVLDHKGLPKLMHSKKNQELIYNNIVHPNKDWEVTLDEVKAAITLFTERSSEIREMVERVQKVTFETYWEIGLINADFKIEVGLNEKRELILGDELELDAMRNMNPQKIVIDGEEYVFEEDSLGTSLEQILWRTPETITKIIEARHSGKQFYRNKVDLMNEEPFNDARKKYNDRAAEETTQRIYIPVAQALSDRFWKKAWLILQAA